MKISDLALTHSQFNEGRIHHYVPTARVSRIGIGFDHALPEPSSGEKKKDILTFASTYPHKCTKLTIERIQAWLVQREDADDVRIHIVGTLPEGCSLPGSNWIHYERMPYQQLMALLREKCSLAVYISEYESYGMPPVECLLNGVPCIASNFPSIRENIPHQYIFDKSDEALFIEVANATYDQTIPFTCPEYPDWNQVANLCIKAMQGH